MKKLTGLLIILALTLGCVFVLASCGGHSHTYDAEAWSYDAVNHWHAATCEHTDAQSDLAAHTYGADFKCTVCNYTHLHAYETEWSYDATNHWKASVCGHADAKSELAAHDYNSAGACTICSYYPDAGSGAHVHKFAKNFTSDETGHWYASTCGHNVRADFAPHDFRPGQVEGTYFCFDCFYVHTHTYSTDWSIGEEGHWHDDVCGHGTTSGFAAHSFGSDGLCTECGFYNVLEHTISEELSSDEFGHWNACECGHSIRFNEAQHTYDDNFVCTVCGYEHTHKVTANEIDYDMTGHWSSVSCGHDVKLNFAPHNYVDGVCTECHFDTASLGDERLAAFAVMYAKSHPTKVDTVTKQSFAGIELNGHITLTVGEIAGESAAIYEVIQDELRSMEEGGRDEFIKDEIVTVHTITQYLESLGTRSVNPVNNMPDAWNIEGTSPIPEGNGIALNLNPAFFSSIEHRANSFECVVMADYTADVFGVDIGADVTLTVVTDGAVIINVVIEYVVPANEDNNLAETTVRIETAYSYDYNRITFD